MTTTNRFSKLSTASLLDLRRHLACEIETGDISAIELRRLDSEVVQIDDVIAKRAS